MQRSVWRWVAVVPPAGATLALVIDGLASAEAMAAARDDSWIILDLIILACLAVSLFVLFAPSRMLCVVSALAMLPSLLAAGMWVLIVGVYTCGGSPPGCEWAYLIPAAFAAGPLGALLTSLEEARRADRLTPRASLR